jgi:hypothetical protein
VRNRSERGRANAEPVMHHGIRGRVGRAPSMAMWRAMSPLFPPSGLGAAPGSRVVEVKLPPRAPTVAGCSEEACRDAEGLVTPGLQPSARAMPRISTRICATSRAT